MKHTPESVKALLEEHSWEEFAEMFPCRVCGRKPGCGPAPRGQVGTQLGCPRGHARFISSGTNMFFTREIAAYEWVSWVQGDPFVRESEERG